VVVLLVAADRIGAAVAARRLADRVQADAHLASRPSASVGGFPFLTQAVEGRYSDVTLTARDVGTSTVTLSRVTTVLHGVKLPLSDVLHESVQRVPVDRARVTLVLTYAEANAYLKQYHVTLAYAGSGKVTVTGQVTVLGQQLSASGTATLHAAGRGVRVSATDLRVGVDGYQTPGVPITVDHTIPLPDLPVQVDVSQVRATSQGLILTGVGRHLVLENDS
jgi:hypothetical protein